MYVVLIMYELDWLGSYSEKGILDFEMVGVSVSRKGAEPNREAAGFE